MTKERIIERLEGMYIRLLGKEAEAEVGLETADDKGDKMYSNFLKGQKDGLRSAAEMLEGLMGEIGDNWETIDNRFH